MDAFRLENYPQHFNEHSHHGSTSHHKGHFVPLTNNYLLRIIDSHKCSTPLVYLFIMQNKKDEPMKCILTVMT